MWDIHIRCSKKFPITRAHATWQQKSLYFVLAMFFKEPLAQTDCASKLRKSCSKGAKKLLQKAENLLKNCSKWKKILANSENIFSKSSVFRVKSIDCLLHFSA